MSFRTFLVLLSIYFSVPTLANSAPAKEAIPTCPSGQHWVRAYHRRAYIRTDGTNVSASTVSAHCQKDPPSYVKWRERLINNAKTPSWARTEKRKNWTTEEQERVFEALSELPEVLLVDSVKTLYRAEKSSAFDQNPAAGDEGVIVIYDAAFKDKQVLSRILAHEFAHELFRQFPDVKRTDYATSTGWKIAISPTTGRYKFIPLRFDYVEEDGPESVTEDFANNIEYHLFEREKLRKTTPKAYDWFGKVFGDKLKLGKGAP